MIFSAAVAGRSLDLRQFPFPNSAKKKRLLWKRGHGNGLPI